MKIKKDFILREIAGDYVLVPVGKTALEFNGMLTVNETGVLLWNLLREGTTTAELVQAVLEEYETDEATAKADVEEYIALLQEKNIIEE